MARVFAVVDDDGNYLDEVVIPETDEIGNPLPVPPNHFTPNYTKRLFTPKWDFELGEWVEGLTPEEVAERETEINKVGNRPTDEDINAMAIMELTALLMGGE